MRFLSTNFYRTLSNCFDIIGRLKSHENDAVHAAITSVDKNRPSKIASCAPGFKNVTIYFVNIFRHSRHWLYRYVTDHEYHCDIQK